MVISVVETFLPYVNGIKLAVKPIMNFRSLALIHCQSGRGHVVH